jgi:hypothetical protein
MIKYKEHEIRLIADEHMWTGIIYRDKSPIHGTPYTDSRQEAEILAKGWIDACTYNDRIVKLEAEVKRLRNALADIRDSAGCASPTSSFMESHDRLPQDLEPWEYFWEKEHRAKCWGIAQRTLKDQG